MELRASTTVVNPVDEMFKNKGDGSEKVVLAP
jgi:hypothetical protein